MTSPLLLLLLGVSLSWAQVRIYDIQGRNLKADALSLPDAFVTVSCGSASLGQTKIMRNNVNPVWKEEFSYLKAKINNVLKLKVYDKDLLLNDPLGVCQTQIKVGTYTVECFLKKGGELHYTYTLNPPQQ